ncbi:MAG: carboxypeptidase M32 [Candidatus Bathyarchaeota archaeon]|nr:carboxypeptidase M32 [Candidatus Bathyarchaeota archaeon]MDH5787594.1 carboxypeptidase M32 [Candidatus Bathyarchaeota archaeon]
MTETMQLDYKKLLGKVKDLLVFQSAEFIIHWDMETMMPPKAIKLRSQQFALLSRIEHKMSTNPEMGTLLDRIMRNPKYDKLNEIQKRNIYLIKKNYDEQTKLPEELVAEIAKQRAITVDIWKKAKAAKNFSVFKPELEKLTELQKKAAEILMKVKETATPYDALIDIYEPKMTAETINKVFNELREGLISILKKCQAAQKQPDMRVLKHKIPIETQRQIAKALAEAVGYDVTSKEAGGRIDETEHPFTSGFYDDVRITTHYYENSFTSSIFSVLHEAGHAIYEQNLNPEWMYQPVGTACSSGLHESQSRFIENIIGRSREFWIYFLPKLKKIANKTLKDVELDHFVHAINHVKPSKIRVEADEVTYGLHIIIRFNIERDLLADKITVKELPEIWNQKYKEYLGIRIDNDSEGVMQDTHWASGAYGYFPTYALGNIYSGQILATMEKYLPHWRQQLLKGNFKNVKEWLVKNVHSRGNLYDPADLTRKITKEKLGVKPYLNYLNDKYSKLYDF